MDTRLPPTMPTLLRRTLVLFLALFAAALVGLVVDPRQISGAPAWLKPAKFAISTAIYTATVAWLGQWTTVWPRLVRAMTHGIALVLVVEDAIIFLQAWRGTTSHFNTSTPLDSALFSVMGVAIALLWMASSVLAVALFRSQFTDAAWGAALRWGMAISVAGSAIGGLMVQPTPAQIEILKAGEQRPTAVGAHTVGAVDGRAGNGGRGVEHGGRGLARPPFSGTSRDPITTFISFPVSQARLSTTSIIYLRPSSELRRADRDPTLAGIAG
jgi:hypothetical protein